MKSRRSFLQLAGAAIAAMACPFVGKAKGEMISRESDDFEGFYRRFLARLGKPRGGGNLPPMTWNRLQRAPTRYRHEIEWQPFGPVYSSPAFAVFALHLNQWGCMVWGRTRCWTIPAASQEDADRIAQDINAMLAFSETPAELRARAEAEFPISSGLETPA
jgi:hypothetical protein